MFDFIKKMVRKDSFALALGGGAILGAAHIGVLRAMKEHEFSIQAISGTSIGSLVGSLYAFGKTPDEIMKIAVDMNWLDISGFSFSKMGLMNNKKMGNMLVDLLGEVKIEDSPIPLYIVATDVSNGTKAIFDSGPLHTAVMASTCLPGVFAPVERDGRLFIDGGLMENVPVTPLKDNGYKPIVAVDLSATRKFKKPESMLEVLTNAMDIGMKNATQLQTADVKLIIRPELSQYSSVSTENVRKMVAEGYKSAHDLFEKG